MESRERITFKVAAANTKAKDTKKKENGDVRDIGDFEYDKSKAKVLKKVVHNINVSLGTLLAAMKELAMLRGSDITPDGKLGGRGFIMPFKDMKSSLNTSISELSDITDTLADELTNPKWGLSNKEVKTLKKEQEQVEDKAEEAESIVEETVPEEPKEEINPDDVKDSMHVEALNRYKSLLDGPPATDKTARGLSKNILANLVRGE
jgi:uncharacterized phage infection (PIP) family protein YhgE